MTWHIDETTAARYARAEVDQVTAASVEAHVVACAACQAVVGDAADHQLLTAVWNAIDDTLDEPRLRWVERALRRLGVSDTESRIVAATTRAHWSFLFVVAASVSLALLSSRSAADGGDDAFALFLFVAPLGPLLATAGAFGRWVDPTYALTKSLPMPVLRIILIRTVSSVVPAIALTALATPFVVDDRGWLAVAWLIPALALSTAVLALSSWMDIEAATMVAVIGWISLLFVMRLSSTEVFTMFSAPLQGISLAMLALATALTVARRTYFDYGGF